MQPRTAQTLKALCLLSDIEPSETLLQQIQTAPDPETATRVVLAAVSSSSEALQTKWRETIWDAWSAKHPNVPLLPELHLPAAAVKNVPALREALEFLQCVAAVPHPPTKSRLETQLRLLRLVRVVKGQLVIVKSRYARFLSFPATQQFYVLWHTDLYHVPWQAYSGPWGEYMQLVQDNAGLLWELSGPHAFLFGTDRTHWCKQATAAYGQLWDHAGISRTDLAWRSWLVDGFDHVVLGSLFERYGLIEASEIPGRFTWTGIGTSLITAEQEDTLPCAGELF